MLESGRKEQSGSRGIEELMEQEGTQPGKHLQVEMTREGEWNKGKSRWRRETQMTFKRPTLWPLSSSTLVFDGVSSGCTNQEAHYLPYSFYLFTCYLDSKVFFFFLNHVQRLNCVKEKTEQNRDLNLGLLKGLWIEFRGPQFWMAKQKNKKQPLIFTNL